MRRRDFITLVGGGSNGETGSGAWEGQACLAMFIRELQQLGWTD
jgi:hypothetical protein